MNYTNTDAASKRSNAGRKPKNTLDRLIPKVWYWAVFSRVRWTNSRFDVEFVPAMDGRKHDSETRVRAFERIKKNGVFPESKDRESVPVDQRKPRQRYFDLILAVDAHPEFRGTAKVIHSPFWKLLKAVPGDLKSAISLVDESLRLLILRRLMDEDALLLLAGLARDVPINTRSGLREDYVSDFEVMLQRATRDLLVDLDLLALFGAMYREACLSFRPAEAEVLGHYFDISLMKLCEQDWIKPVGGDVEDIARQRVLYGVGDYLPESALRVQSALGVAYAIGQHEMR